MKIDVVQEHSQLNTRMHQLGIQPSISIADRGGIGLIAHAKFAAFEGEYTPAPCLMLTLCTKHIGRMKRVGDGPELNGVLRPGTVAIALPNTAATGYWSQTEMLGIAVNLDALSGPEKTITSEDLLPAASLLHNDTLLTSVMTALWQDAEIHGLSGAFFEQGIRVLLKHLTNFQGKQHQVTRCYPLTGVRLKQVVDLMESRLGEDISVSELAALTGQDVRTFTRSFVAATGLPPYAYFTYRRMEFAKQLLRNHQLPVTDIALSVGYTNPSKFAAAFRRFCGLAPSLWRHQNKSS